LRFGIPGQKLIEVFGIREVQTAATRQQKLSADGGHGIKQMDFMPQFGQYFGRHEPCRTPTDNGNFDWLCMSLCI
jgi:hypothetical protein